jgi:hypothetical protein
MDIYNQEYLKRFRDQARTEKGRRIYAARWKFITSYVNKGTLLDYGAGPGAFNEMGPETFDKDNYDVNPYSGYNTIPDKKWNIVTMWDSIEHIPDFYGTIKKLDPDWLFLSTPNVENVKGPITEWKHYRPKEHLYYFDKYSLKIILESLGYYILDYHFEEGAIRDPENPEAIISVVARKKWWDDAVSSKE